MCAPLVIVVSSLESVIDTLTYLNSLHSTAALAQGLAIRLESAPVALPQGHISSMHFFSLNGKLSGAVHSVGIGF